MEFKIGTKVYNPNTREYGIIEKCQGQIVTIRIVKTEDSNGNQIISDKRIGTCYSIDSSFLYTTNSFNHPVVANNQDIREHFLKNKDGFIYWGIDPLS